MALETSSVPDVAVPWRARHRLQQCESLRMKALQREFSTESEAQASPQTPSRLIPRRGNALPSATQSGVITDVSKRRRLKRAPSPFRNYVHAGVRVWPSRLAPGDTLV